MLEQLTSNHTLNPQLRLIRFSWGRFNRRDTIEFTPGFNLLSQGSQIERTIILRLIRYAMGGSHSRIENETRRETNEVTLEFTANGKRVTTNRGFLHPDGQFLVSVAGSGSWRTIPTCGGKR